MLLAEALGAPFFDADDFHPVSNVEKMSNGISLNDEDRKPWLETLARKLSEWEEGGGAVLACSALKESYRVTLQSQCSGPLRWLVLNASEELLADRLASRKGHFFDQKLLSSQLEAFEKPDYGWTIDVTAPPEEIVLSVLKRLGEV